MYEVRISHFTKQRYRVGVPKQAITGSHSYEIIKHLIFYLSEINLYSDNNYCAKTLAATTDIAKIDIFDQQICCKQFCSINVLLILDDYYYCGQSS